MFATVNAPDNLCPYVDLTQELGALLAQIYRASKRGIFPVTIRTTGGPLTFDSLSAMVSFANGLKRGAALFAPTQEGLFDQET
jgi:hypothetical protein